MKKQPLIPLFSTFTLRTTFHNLKFYKKRNYNYLYSLKIDIIFVNWISIIKIKDDILGLWKF